MAQLWGGRFTKETDKLVYNFNASISFDRKFYEQDIRGSKAHVAMLAKQGILTEEEKIQIENGLDGILADVRSGKLEITSEYEDIHSFVEANLIDRIGDAGKKLHTGRSRNDQVALDMKLYVRDEIDETDELVKKLLEALQKIMEENIHTYMPGFTHLQKAQPVTLAHHVGAYFEMFVRDRSRLSDIRKRMNTCPLGAGALAGRTGRAAPRGPGRGGHLQGGHRLRAGVVHRPGQDPRRQGLHHHDRPLRQGAHRRPGRGVRRRPEGGQRRNARLH